MLTGSMPKVSKNGAWSVLQRCERDGYGLVQQGLATIVRIAQQEEDNKHALAAGQWLVTYGEGLWREKLAKSEAARVAALPPPSDRETILHELRGLYAKALGSSPLVEAQPDPEPEQS